MSRLITIHDFSPSRAASGALLNAAASSLAESGIVMGPFNSHLYEYVPTHVSLWTKPNAKLPFPQNLQKQWEEMASRLDSGKDVLLHTFTLSPQAHEFFYQQFTSRIDQNRHSLHSLLVIGSPNLLLEQYFRAVGFSPSPATLEAYITLLRELLQLVRTLSERIGSDSLTLLPNLTQSCVSLLDADLAKQIMAWLGMPCPETLPRPFANPSFRSHMSRRLRSVLEVRDNAWPAMDPADIEEALFKTDEALPEDFLSPPELRHSFSDSSRDSVRELEEILNIAPGSFAAQEAFLAAPRAERVPSLPDEVVQKFLSNLDSRSSATLGQRLHNDKDILSADQKTVLHHLDKAGTFSVIGDAEPPVELTVLTMTYNHEKYIAQCMDSVLAQKTTFPIRHIVLDHHSEDGTAAIVAEYAKHHPSIRPVLLSHRRSNENVYGLFARCRTKYVSLCDGDDYFLKPDKLEKQIDFLERHPDHALCFHPVLAVFEDGRKPAIYPPLDTVPQRNNGEIYLSDLIKTNFMQTNSVVYRWRFTEGLPKWFRSDLCPGDWYWHLLHAETGKIGFIPEIMSAYRRHAGALYAQAMMSRLNHRRRLGLPELGTYQAIDEHFQGRYHRPLSVLASAVFSDFVEIMINEDESRLLDWAAEKYPDFARDFFKSLSALDKTPNDG